MAPWQGGRAEDPGRGETLHIMAARSREAAGEEERVHAFQGRAHGGPAVPTRLHLLTLHLAINPSVDRSVSHTHDPGTCQKPHP